MAKGNKKAITKDKIDKGFDDWVKVFDDLIDSANKCFMPLLAKSLELNKEIVNVYRKAFNKVANE